MDSFELNKLIGAFLGVVFIVFSVSLISEAIFDSPAPETPGYAIVVTEDEDAGAGAEQPAQETVLPLLASADPSAGESVFRRCQACHTTEEGGANKVGPNLWNTVGNSVAHHEDFSYSAALREFSQGGEVTWTYENLDAFLLNPKGLVPGTAMSFAGLRNVQDRANVIAYLRTLSNDPEPLPAEEPAQVDDAEAAPAEDAADEAAPASEDVQGAAEGREAGEQEAAPASGEENSASPNVEEEGQSAPNGAEEAEPVQ